MNRGKTLSELAAELDRRSNVMADYVAPTTALTVGVAGEGEAQKPFIDISGESIVGINEIAHRQVATHIDVPHRYYQRMLHEAPDMWQRDVNHWLHEGEKSRMIRTLDGDARAFLSDSYLRIDNDEVASQVFEHLLQHPSHPRALSTNVTDTKLYLKFLFPDLEYEVKPGDVIHPGFTVTNSEVGLGSYSVGGFFFRSYCENGCVFGSKDAGIGVQRRHTGGRSIGDAEYQVISNETQQKIGEALMAETKDVVTALGDQKFLNVMGEKLRAAAQSKPAENPEAAVILLAKAVGLNEKERQQTLVHMIEDKDYSLWGAANAVTKLANTQESYDRSSELEGLGEKILTMQLRQWDRIASTVEVPRTRSNTLQLAA